MIWKKRIISKLLGGGRKPSPPPPVATALHAHIVRESRSDLTMGGGGLVLR